MSIYRRKIVVLLVAGIMFTVLKPYAGQSSLHFFITDSRGVSERIVNEILLNAELARQKITDKLKRHFQQRTEIVLCVTPEEFKASTTQPPEHILACAVAVRNLIYINLSLLSQYPTEQFLHTLKHEYAHIYLGNMCPERLPRWLEEGIAMHLAGDWQIDDAVSLALARILGRHIPLAELERAFPPEPGAMRLAYLQSYSVVNYLLKQRYQGAGIQVLIDDLTDPVNGAERILTFWNKLLRDGLELSWRNATRYSLFNWIAVLSSSSILMLLTSLLFILAYIRKQQRTRPVLEEWEKEEKYYSRYDSSKKYSDYSNDQY
ncbi:MAG: peptidase MA family metallohydrolase [Candidatus Sumerlaeia bacterium]|nr:peptidase MA family metallohydrolase [Candidatus Sumerlaeia bacterium]